MKQKVQAHASIARTVTRVLSTESLPLPTTSSTGTSFCLSDVASTHGTAHHDTINHSAAHNPTPACWRSIDDTQTTKHVALDASTHTPVQLVQTQLVSSWLKAVHIGWNLQIVVVQEKGACMDTPYYQPAPPIADSSWYIPPALPNLSILAEEHSS